MTNKLALVVAVVLGVLSIVFIKVYVDKIKFQAEAAAQPVSVYAAARELPAGTVVTAGDIAKIEVPSAALGGFAGSECTDKTAIENWKLIAPMKQGQIFQVYHFRQAAGAGKKLQIPPTFRALTVPVNQTNGLAGMLRPGDKIDVVVTQEFQFSPPGAPPGMAKERIRATRTMLKNVMIRATDASTEADTAYSDYQTITLALSPTDVNRMLHVIDIGAPYHFVKRDEAAIDSNGMDVRFNENDFDEVEAEVRRYFETKRPR